MTTPIYGIETYDAAGNIMFSSRHMNMFIVDFFPVSSATSRAYPEVPYKVFCQVIYGGQEWWPVGTDLVNPDKSKIGAMSVSVSYSAGYPVVSFTPVGSPGLQFYAQVFHWGESI